jgi:hypothetical protein
MADPEMRTFEDFWPFYVREHANKTNRMLHFLGTSLFLGSTAAGLLTGRKAFFVAGPMLGYGFAWVGHFFVEGNRPATFKYPLRSLRADFVMWGKMLAGTMDDEVERVKQKESDEAKSRAVAAATMN